MLNGEVLGQKFYAARNPVWTRYGKAGKPMISLRANRQKGGPGVGEQYMQRSKFAHAAISLYGTKGKDARGMPMMAVRMSGALGGYHPEAQKQKIAAKAAEAHNAAVQRWSGAVAPATTYGGSYGQF